MSQETIADLNTNTLIGCVATRGQAWHYRAADQGAQSNHYDGYVPVGDVRRRLFGWQAEKRRVAMEIPAELGDMDHLDADGQPALWVIQDDIVGIGRNDSYARLGVFSADYEPHQYDAWLIGGPADLIDQSSGELGISSAGLLKGGAVAWVEISVPDSITTPEGVTFRPNLLACTSFNGSIATTYKRTVTNTVCDNTMAAALGEAGQQYKVKHTRFSQMRLSDAREALAMVHDTAADFEAEVAELCRLEVTDKQWGAFLDAHASLTDDHGTVLTGRGATMAQNKRDTLGTLWRSDERVAPWAGTAYGVLQAVNTYEHHYASVRGSDRADRNMLRAVKGEWENIDRESVATLRRVLISA
jgi:phage/plasmid-like protein (TIGR03299 family)